MRRYSRMAEVRPEAVSREPQHTGDPAQNVKLLSVAMVGLMILVLLGPYINFKPAPFTGEGNPLRQVYYVIIFATVAWAARVDRQVSRLFVVPASVIVVLGWCWLSLGWSDSFDIAIRRLVLTTIIIWTIYLATETNGYRRTLAVLRQVAIATLILNFITVLLFPSFGIHDVDVLGDPGIVGSWRGILQQKNFAGPVCAFTAIYFLFDARQIRPMVRAIVLVLTAIFLIGTKSKTSMALLAVSCGVGYLFTRYNPRHRLLVSSLFVLLILTVTLSTWIFWDAITEPFSSEDSLTGRVQIWPKIILYWKEHWLLGSGYGSFWNVGPNGPVFTIARNWVADLGNGHSGYLDLLVQIGLPGLVIAVVLLIIWPILKLLNSRTIDRQSGGLIFACLLFCAGHNFTETSLLERDAIVQVFFVFSLAMIGPATRGDRVPVDPTLPGQLPGGREPLAPKRRFRAAA